MGRTQGRSVQAPQATMTAAMTTRTTSGTRTAASSGTSPPDCAVSRSTHCRHRVGGEHVRDRDDGRGGAECDEQGAPFPAYREPQQPDAGRDLGQQHQCPGPREPEAEVDGGRVQQVDVAHDALEQDRRQWQHPPPGATGEPQHDTHLEHGPAEQERWPRQVPQQGKHLGHGRRVQERVALPHVGGVRIGDVHGPVRVGVVDEAARPQDQVDQVDVDEHAHEDERVQQCPECAPMCFDDAPSGCGSPGGARCHEGQPWATSTVSRCITRHMLARWRRPHTRGVGLRIKRVVTPARRALPLR